LQHKQSHRVSRVQQSITPEMTDCREALVHSLGTAQKHQRVRLDPVKRSSNDGHPWPPLSLGDIRHHHSLRRPRFAPMFAKRAVARSYELTEWHSGSNQRLGERKSRFPPQQPPPRPRSGPHPPSGGSGAAAPESASSLPEI